MYTVKTILLLNLMVICSLVGACSGSDSPEATPTATTAPVPIATSTPTLVATPVIGFAPPYVGAEGPLFGGAVEIPNAWIVPSQQSKQAVASYLKTTVAQLNWVNPGLVDPVTPGTLIAIPPNYVVFEDESFSSIAAATGMPEPLLRALNPKLSAGSALPSGVVLSIPRIVVMQEATTVAELAKSLAFPDAALLSANPDLAQGSAINAGTVLVLPPGDTGQ